jgi:hypothetical protein
MSERYAFRIPVGDWSDDGHGKVQWYDATAAKPIDAVREAYFAAKKRLPKACCPESFCDGYQEPEMAQASRDALKKAGVEVPEEFCADEMAAIVVWFLNQGDDALDVRLDGKPPAMLPFYGFDKKRRHIGNFGYGLFS